MITTFGNKTKSLLLLVGFSLAMGSQLAHAQASKASPVQATQTAQTAQTEAQQVNINKADAETLADVLVGVGASKAKAIVEYREAHGPFTSLEQLEEVAGIGKSILSTNRQRIKLE
jgi:competence protein ComEA